VILADEVRRNGEHRLRNAGLQGAVHQDEVLVLGRHDVKDGADP
jgi:hypothetical protein